MWPGCVLGRAPAKTCERAVVETSAGPSTASDLSLYWEPIRNRLTSSQWKYSPSCVCLSDRAESWRVRENSSPDLIYVPRTGCFPL